MTAILSDDPQAIEKLQEKLAKMETDRDFMKSVNKDFKQAKGDASKMKIIPEQQRQQLIDKIEKAYSWEKQPYPSWKLTNLGANIRTVKKRIEQLVKSSGDETTTKMVNGVEVIDNVELNRLQLFFDGKPELKIRTSLKANGFKWAPSLECWQHHRSTQANYAADNVLKNLGEERLVKPSVQAEKPDHVSMAIKKHGAFFAFNKDQYDREAKEGIKYISLGAGLVVPESAHVELIADLNKASVQSVLDDKQGSSDKEIIWRELANHEAQISGSIDATVDALKGYNIPVEHVQAEYKEYMNHCLKNNIF